MLQSLGLGFVFKAKDETQETIHKVKENLHELKEAGEHAHHSLFGALKMSGTAMAGIGLAIGAAGVAGAFEFAEHAEQFSSAIRQAGVAAHATTEELEAFEEMAKSKALGQLKGSAIETAQTLAELAKEGFNLQESGQAVDATLNLMRLSMGALGSREAAGLVHDTLSQFGMQAGQSGELVDKLAFAMREFKFRAEELRPAMSGLASGAQLTHASFDDVLIGVGLLKQVFPSASKAAGSMNVALQQLAQPHAAKALAGMGVAMKDSHGHIIPLLDVMKNLAEKTKHMTEAQLAAHLATVGSSRSAGGLITIIDALKKGVVDSSGHTLTGAAALDFYRKKLNDTQGEAKRMADMLGDDMGGALKALKGALSNAAVSLGGLFEGGFKTGIQNANILIRGLVQLFTEGGFSGDVAKALDKHSGIKDFAVGVFLWVKRIQNFFTTLGDGFRAAFEPFQPVLAELVQAFGFLGNELGITAQSAGDNEGKWNAFGSAGAHVGEILAELAGVVIPLLKGAVLLLAGAIEMAKEGWGSFGGTLGGVWSIVSGFVRAVGGLLSGNWKTAWDGFVDVVKGAALTVVNILMGVLGWVAKAIDGVGKVFGKDWDHAGMVKDLQKDWTGNIKFGANELKSVVQGEPSPAKAAQEGQAKASASAFAALTGGEAGRAEETHHTHVSLHVDGEKLAHAHAKAKRSAGARSFTSVPAEEGSF